MEAILKRLSFYVVVYRQIPHFFFCYFLLDCLVFRPPCWCFDPQQTLQTQNAIAIVVGVHADFKQGLFRTWIINVKVVMKTIILILIYIVLESEK